MNNLEQLTATRETCDMLVDRGIHEVAFMWWLRSPESNSEWEVCLLDNPTPVPGMCIPAWTKQELDAMIGPDLPKPDLYTKQELGNDRLSMSRAKLDAAKAHLKTLMIGKAAKAEMLSAQMLASDLGKEVDRYLADSLKYPIFTPNKLFEFINGAEASAMVLLMMLDADLLKAEDCMIRYFKLFKPKV